jgi:MFS family permease
MRRGGEKRNLLTTNRGFLLYWSGRTTSIAGNQLARVALTVLVYELRGGAAGVSVLLLAFIIPRLIGPLAGVLADRADSKRLMVGCDLAQAVLFGVLAWVRWWPGVIIIVLVASLFATLYFPAGRSNIPALVGRENLARANTLLAIGANTALAAGPAVAGLLLAFGGPGVALLVNAATFVVSAILTMRIPGLRTGSGTRAAGAPVTMFGVARAGFAIAWRNPVARTVAIVLLPGVGFASLDNAAMIFLVRNGFHASASVYSWMVTALSIGMAGLPLLLSAMSRSLSGRTLFLGGAGVFGAATIATGLSPALAGGIGAQFVAGAGNGMENIGIDTVLQESTADEEMGTVFGTVYTTPYIGQIIAYLVATPCILAFGPRTTFVIAGIGVLVVTAISFVALPPAIKAEASERRGS